MRTFGRHPWAIFLIIVIAIAANAAGYYFNLWTRMAPYDEVVHGFTIFAISLLLGVIALGPVLNASGRHEFWVILAIASFGIAVGALWEVAEWTYDQFVPRNAIQGKLDTIIDLLMDSIGGLLGGWLAFVWKARA